MTKWDIALWSLELPCYLRWKQGVCLFAFLLFLTSQGFRTKPHLAEVTQPDAPFPHSPKRLRQAETLDTDIHFTDEQTKVPEGVSNDTERSKGPSLQRNTEKMSENCWNQVHWNPARK